MKKLVLLMAVLLPGVAMAQEVVEFDAPEVKPHWVHVKDGNGNVIGRVNPTPHFALEAI